MIDIDSLVRANIRELTPYSLARSESNLKSAILMDANESPFNTGFNRYPPPSRIELKTLAAKMVHSTLLPENVFAGNGSDEAIDLLIRVFCRPGIDNTLSISPTYGMYKVLSAINDVEYRESPLEYRESPFKDGYFFKAKELLSLACLNTKIIFLCSPNNPTGNLLDKKEIIYVLDNFKGLVVIDEAYIDFSGDSGFASLIDRYNNLVTLRTLSKSKGMAAIRVGFAFASAQIISYLERVKYPYNLNINSQELAIKSIKENSQKPVDYIKKERAWLEAELLQVKGVKTVFKSDTNFVLIEIDNANEIASMLKERGVIVRNFSKQPGCKDCLRISVGKHYQNQKLIRVLKEEDSPESNAFVESNIIEISRITQESRVNVILYKEEPGIREICTGVSFLDHMLDLLILNSAIGADITVKGDLDIDTHHTIEDTAIVLGKAIASLYRSKMGYNRYGFVLPMDESRAEVLIDLGGRYGFKWDVSFEGSGTGDFPVDMFSHFFDSMASNGMFTLHISAIGHNDHHIAESIFKAFGRALRIALSQNIDEYQLPSSKGVI